MQVRLEMKNRVISRAHSFTRQNLTNAAANLVNSAAHRGKADEIPGLTGYSAAQFHDKNPNSAARREIQRGLGKLGALVIR